MTAGINETRDGRRVFSRDVLEFGAVASVLAVLDLLTALLPRDDPAIEIPVYLSDGIFSLEMARIPLSSIFLGAAWSLVFIPMVGVLALKRLNETRMAVHAISRDGVRQQWISPRSMEITKDLLVGATCIFMIGFFTMEFTGFILDWLNGRSSGEPVQDSLQAWLFFLKFHVGWPLFHAGRGGVVTMIGLIPSGLSSGLSSKNEGLKRGGVVVAISIIPGFSSMFSFILAPGLPASLAGEKLLLVVFLAAMYTTTFLLGLIPILKDRKLVPGPFSTYAPLPCLQLVFLVLALIAGA